MNEDPDHGPTKIYPSEGGGGGKWLLGGLAAVVLLGGGYFAWKSMAPAQDSMQVASTDTYDDAYGAAPLHAGPLPADEEPMTANIAADESTPAAASASAAPRAAAPARRAPVTPARAETPPPAPVPEATIGITPVNLMSDEVQTADDIVITAAPRPVWARTPTARRLAALYPARALDRGREGEASLSCTVLAGGALDCAQVSETPGFGDAALRVSRTLRHAPQRADGSDAAGTPLNLRVVFRIPENERRG